MGTILQFVNFNSSVSVGFWYSLANKKLHTLKLEEHPLPIQTHFSPKSQNQNCTLLVEPNSIDEIDYKVIPGSVIVRGVLHNTNTLNGFKDLDKKKLFTNVAQEVWNDIESGRALSDPTLLNKVLLLTFADLKSYKFYYWFGFPALPFSSPVQLTKSLSLQEDVILKDKVEELLKLHSNKGYPPYFILKITSESIEMIDLKDISKIENNSDENIYFVFNDPSTLGHHPGWPLRNYLILIAHYTNLKSLKILCLRDFDINEQQIYKSVVLHLSIENLDDDKNTLINKAIGWELNHKGLLAPRLVNLQSTMDPLKLATASVDLNLQLMRWRLLPSLNLEKISQSKCLLLGAGTLGCNVARSLMSWGVRTITFVDNGKISYSNPVRQSLYQFKDCLDGSKFKAEAAATHLKEIFPGMESKGIVLSIPMPGHSVSNDQIEDVKDSIIKLEQLINEHDVIFLLTDSRESRWLPTLICSSLGKLAINVALGFDTYLILRHGVNIHTNNNNNNNLGCYFCNDVVAPQNSLRDRTLDQQCTVARPGLSSIAGAISVELLVAILHHPLLGEAPSEVDNNLSNVTSNPIGIIPHSIRGFITHFNNMLVTGHCYDKCTACSKTVIDEYRNKNQDFLFQVFNNPTYLEDITGLTQLKKESEELVWESAESDDF